MRSTPRPCVCVCKCKNKKLRKRSLSGLSSCLSLCLSRMIQAPVLCYVSHCNQTGRGKKKRRKPGLSEEFHFNVNEREMIQNQSAQMERRRGGGRRPGESSSAGSRRLVCFVLWPPTKITRPTSDKDTHTHTHTRRQTRRNEGTAGGDRGVRVWTMSKRADE